MSKIFSRKKCSCGYGQKGVRIGYRGCSVHDSGVRFMPKTPNLHELIQKEVRRLILAEAQGHEKLIVLAMKSNMWPVTASDGYGETIIRFLKPGFWLGLRMRWVMWKKKRGRK